MALGSGRDYKTRDRAARANLEVHKKRMDQLIAEGKTKDEASQQAYREIIDGTLRDQVKAVIEQIKVRQNRRG